MKMGMKMTVIASMLAVGLMAGNGIAQNGTTTTTSQQQMGGGMMNGAMMGGQNSWGMGCDGMMGGMMMNRMSPDQQQEFMNQTTDLRKKMMEKRFAYMEAMRNPDTNPRDLAKIEKEMLDLRSEMIDKMNSLQGKR